MPISATLALEKHCYVSDSQEELLNLCEGWEHRSSKRCTLDETPSQPFLNLNELPTEPPGVLLESDSEDSDDTECNGVHPRSSGMGVASKPITIKGRSTKWR